MIRTALLSVSDKNGIVPFAKALHEQGIKLISTGGTAKLLAENNLPVVEVSSLTKFPEMLDGRVKTLHPMVFGGILGKRDDNTHIQEMQQYQIPHIDLVIVDLYPFEETVANTTDEKAIIEKIDIGGPSMIRAAAKNFRDVTVIAAKTEYANLENILTEQNGTITLAQRKELATKAFQVVARYDVAIANYFDPAASLQFVNATASPRSLRYGENPHQSATFYGELASLFHQLNGKELSYNNLVDVDAAVQLISEFTATTFAIIKHTNVCGIAQRNTVKETWEAALAGDPESAFGGVLVCNREIDATTAEAIASIFFEVLIAPSFAPEALSILQAKKNRILLEQKQAINVGTQFKSVLNGVLTQQNDSGNYAEWKEAGGRNCTSTEKENLDFANLVCKHLKSNAIALVQNKQLIGKGCGQTSRIDSLRQALEKAKQFNANLQGAVLASDAFFPFDDCVKMAHAAGIVAFIQPGGSVRDQDSIDYCKQNNLALVITGLRHFKH